MSVPPSPAGAQTPDTASPIALVAAGDSAWNAHDHARALRAYQAAVRRDSTISSRAIFRLATLLSYEDRLTEAIALFRRYVQMEPRDDEGRIALARTMAWAGDYDGAIIVYDSILARDTTYRDAAKGIARTLAWRGDLANSELRWRALTKQTPRDPETWIGLAQVLRWSGRPVAAREALQRALDADSASDEARAQLRWVDAELTPGVQLDVIPSNDSDQNRATWYGATFGLHPSWNGRLTFGAGARIASFQALRARSLSARARNRWSLGVGKWSATSEFGVAHLAGDEGGTSRDIRRPTKLIAAAGISGLVAPRLSLGINASYTPFDETAALILNGITMSSANADLSLALPAGFSFDAGGGLARMSGGATSNTRISGLATLRYAISRSLSTAATVRGFGYDTVATDGYFSPKSYLLAEGSLRYRWGRDLGWRFGGEGGIGTQRVRLTGDATSRLATRGALDLGYQFAPGYGVTLSGTLANLPSSRTIDAEGYRWYAFGLSANVLIR